MSNDNNELVVEDCEIDNSYEEENLEGHEGVISTSAIDLIDRNSLSDAEVAELVSVDFTAELDVHLDSNHLTSFDASSEDLSGTTDQLTVDIADDEHMVEDDCFGTPQFVEPAILLSAEEQFEANLDIEADAEFEGKASTIQPDLIENDSTNPFDSNSNLTETNPFNIEETGIGEDGKINHIDSTVSSLNPFGDEEEVTGAVKLATREKSLMVKKSVLIEEKKPFNPFNEDSVEDEISDGKKQTLDRKRYATESLTSPIVTSSATVSKITQKSTSSSLPSGNNSAEINQKNMFTVEVNELRSLGFDMICIRSELQKAFGDPISARHLLTSKLLDSKTGIANDDIYIWKSPVMVRIGGWLPNVKDEAGAAHTSFYVNVTMTLGNESWRIGRRYSEFHKFYSAIYSQLCKSFPNNGMKNLFPTDRLSNWLSLTNQETINDSRRKSLDGWLRELINSPALMLHDPSRKAVFSFLEVDENMLKVKKILPSEKESRSTQVPIVNKTTKGSGSCPQGGIISEGSAATCQSTIRSSSPSPISPPVKQSEEDILFAARKRSALAAQKNDYKSQSSLSPDRESFATTSKRGSEPSSSGFSNEFHNNTLHSKSFAKRVSGSSSSNS